MNTESILKQAPFAPSAPTVGRALTGLDVAIRYLLYPLLAATTLAYLWLELSGPRTSIGQHYGAYLAALVVVMVVVEATHPLRREWRMTWGARRTTQNGLLICAVAFA